MTVYIVGKQVEEDYNYCLRKFQKVEDILLHSGYEVINPMKILPQTIGWENRLDIMKTHLINSDVALFLPDWKDMCGSHMERYWAKRNDITIIDYEDFLMELY